LPEDLLGLCGTNRQVQAGKFHDDNLIMCWCWLYRPTSVYCRKYQEDCMAWFSFEFERHYFSVNAFVGTGQQVMAPGWWWLCHRISSHSMKGGACNGVLGWPLQSSVITCKILKQITMILRILTCYFKIVHYAN
jgi:hypothetical protein